jgi:hypothetical protein
MSLLIAGLIADDLNSVMAEDRQDPAVGEFLDGGSAALITGISRQPAGFDQLIGSEFQSAAAAAGVRLRYSSSATEAVAEGIQIQIVSPLIALTDSVQFRDPWWQHLSTAAVLSLLLFDRTKPACLVVLFGHGLPCMGALSDCRLLDVWATWFLLAGGTPNAGSFLLQEPSSGVDPGDEERLLTRLRQLYGDG